MKDVGKARKSIRRGNLCLKLGLWLFSVVVLGHAVTAAYHQFWPMSSWVKYYSIVPSKKEFDIGERITHVADFEVSRVSNLEYQDKTMCSIDDSDFYKMDYQETSNPAHPVTPRTKKMFSLVDFVTTQEMKCYTQSAVVLHLGNGRERVQDLPDKNFFYVVDKSKKEVTE